MNENNHNPIEPIENKILTEKNADIAKINEITESDLGLISDFQRSTQFASTSEGAIIEEITENLMKNPPIVPKETDEGSIREEELPRIGKFILLSEISRSPNGVVYKAKQTDLTNRIVALKVISSESNSLDDKFERFKQEIKLITELSHPNIVKVYEVTDAKPWLFFTMEYIEGASLAELVKQKTFNDFEATKIIMKVAKGVYYANQKGIIHRDLKPSNILIVSETNEPMIVDFGLAKDIKADVKITQTGVALGTPSYMPPEQARGAQCSLDSRSDVYSLGATLYELVTGKVVFGGENTYEILRNVVDKSPVRPRKNNPSISPALEAIILKCLCKKQNERYQNSLELANDLKRFLRGEWITAKQNTPVNRFLSKIYSYRYFVYSMLVAALFIVIFLLSGYFKKEIDRNPEERKLFEDKVHKQFKIINSEPKAKDEQEFWLHDEIWLAPSNKFFTADFHKLNYSGIILKEPIKMTDFKLEWTLEVLPFTEEQPNFSFFLTRTDKNLKINPYLDPVFSDGYLITFGADNNAHTVMYKNGVPQIADSRIKLHSEVYNIVLQVNSGDFIIEIQDNNRRVNIIEFQDDFPLAITLGGYFGFIAVKTPVVLSNLKLTLISPPTDELERANRLFNLGLYSEASIDYRQKELFAEARKNDRIHTIAKFKYLLCAEKNGDISTENFIEEILKLQPKLQQYNSFCFTKVLLNSYFKTSKFQDFLILFKNALNNRITSRSEIGRLLTLGWTIANSALIKSELLSKLSAISPLLTLITLSETTLQQKLSKHYAGNSKAAIFNALLISSYQKNRQSCPVLEFARSLLKQIVEWTKPTSVHQNRIIHNESLFLIKLIELINLNWNEKQEEFDDSTQNYKKNEQFLKDIALIVGNYDYQALSYRNKLYLLVYYEKFIKKFNKNILTDDIAQGLKSEKNKLADKRAGFKALHWKQLLIDKINEISLKFKDSESTE